MYICIVCVLYSIFLEVYMRYTDLPMRKFENISPEGNIFSKRLNWQVYITHIDRSTMDNNLLRFISVRLQSSSLIATPSEHWLQVYIFKYKPSTKFIYKI